MNEPDNRDREALTDGGTAPGDAARDEPFEVTRPPRRRAGDLDRGGSGLLQPRTSLTSLRQGPVRNGLIGLAVVGAAAPLAVNRYQQALRTDPSHESALAHGIEPGAEGSLTDTWRGMEATRVSEAEVRDAMVAESLNRYAEYDLNRELAESIYDQALANDIDPEIAFGLVRAESSFKNSSTSVVGAVGLTQLMPRTAAGVEPGVTRAQLREPQTNLRIGFSSLRSLIDKYGGDTDMALLAYNRGPGTVDRELARGRSPDNGYAAFVRGITDHGHTLFTGG